MSDDLDVLLPEQEVRVSGDRLVRVFPFKWRDTKRALAIVERYLTVLQSAATGGEVAKALLAKGGEQTQQDVQTLITLTTGKNSDFIDELSFLDVLNLLSTAVELNLSFFFRVGDRLAAVGNRRKPEATAE
ncbi:MAG: hypothetical protein DDT26_00106 [Dehalococcoidia bacterium]|nr:hypothetical protein [Chloroflexota bacterium]